MTKTGVCGAVVSYNPAPDIIQNVQLLREQVDDVIVVDNGSHTECCSRLEKLQDSGACKVVFNGQNLGIAGALNIAVEYALQAGQEWIALFDQDSRVTPDFINSMLATYGRSDCKERVGIVAPVWRDLNSGALCRPMMDSNRKIVAAMTSGSMARVSTFEKYGMFDERLFIDYVDTEFCLRLRSQGLIILESSESELLHCLGSMRSHTFFSKSFFTTNHSAVRRYYITRNRCVVMRKYLLQEPRWVMHDCLSMLKETIKILITEREKRAKLKHFVTGIADAVSGRMGKRFGVESAQL